MALQPAYQPIRAPVQTQIRWLCLGERKRDASVLLSGVQGNQRAVVPQREILIDIGASKIGRNGNEMPSIFLIGHYLHTQESYDAVKENKLCQKSDSSGACGGNTFTYRNRPIY